MQGLVLTAICGFMLVAACVVWVFFVCMAGSVALTVTLITGVIEVLVYINQKFRLITKWRKRS